MSAIARSSARSRWASAASCFASSDAASVRSRSAFVSSRNLIEICFSRSAVRVSDGGELGLQLGQALLLRRGRLGPLPELALPLLELRLRRGHLRRARVDLGGAEREALRADEILVEASLDVGELRTHVLLARERLVELLPDRVDLVVAGRLGGDGRLGRRRLRRRGRGWASGSAAGSSLSRRACSWARRPVPNPCSISCSPGAIRRAS